MTRSCIAAALYFLTLGLGSFRPQLRKQSGLYSKQFDRFVTSPIRADARFDQVAIGDNSLQRSDSKSSASYSLSTCLQHRDAEHATDCVSSTGRVGDSQFEAGHSRSV